IYPGHDVAYAYYIFMVDIEELHFYNFKMQIKKTVPFDELVSVTTYDPLISNHTVSVQYNVDNEIYDIQTVIKGSQLTFPEDPEKDNHVFVGWYSDPLFYYAYDPSTVVVNGFQLYAKFVLDSLNINFYNGSILYETKTIDYGDSIDFLPLNPKENDYLITNYEVNFTSSQFTGDDLIVIDGVIWEVNKTNTITQETGSLKISGTNAELFTELITQEPIPYATKIQLKVKSFYTIQGGYGQIEIFTSADKINWSKRGSNLFEADETFTFTAGNNGPVYIKIKAKEYPSVYIYYMKIKSNLSSIEGKKYNFDNWYHDQEWQIPYNENDVFTENTNLYAGYKEKKYTLSFDSNNGSPVTSQLYYEDDEIIMPEYNPSRIGYVFAGWYLDEELEEEFNLETMPGEDVTLYAKWVETEETQFLIEFYLDEELYTYIVLAEEQELILPPAPPTEENQLFLGWYYDEEFTESFKVSDPIDDDIVLYGKFGADSGGNGGTELPPDDPTTPGTGLTFKKEYIFYVVLGVIVLAVVSSLIRKRK
ncbi:MAG TPA: InlB B-repeat-containing protein, partial [Edaphocola sp.]|nr:InlB B-repeat-containing protein [Edaphocola sp.]